VRGLLITLIATVSMWGQAAGGHASAPEADPWFSTFSMIAFDPATSELGVGVQSRAFAAGAAVPYAKPGVGAVATQASANRQYGPQAIALLEKGLSPAEVVKEIQAWANAEPARPSKEKIDFPGIFASFAGFAFRRHAADTDQGCDAIRRSAATTATGRDRKNPCAYWQPRRRSATN